MSFQKISEICNKIGITVGKYEDDGSFTGKLTPGKEPTLPENMDDLSSEQLGSLLNIHSEWSNYLKSRLTEYEVALQDLSADLENYSAAKLVEGGIEEKVTFAKAKLRIDKEYLDKLSMRDDVKAICKMLENAVAISENRVSAISRNISARSTSMGALNRRENINVSQTFNRSKRVS
jgi:hypothetical protein